jgi:anti-anti-sigma factor
LRFVCPHDGHAVAAVRGELDFSSPDAASVIAALTARHQVVVVELSALEFIDCSALAALPGVQTPARQSGGDVLLAAPGVWAKAMLANADG